jgi:hypothetical protein
MVQDVQVCLLFALSSTQVQLLVALYAHGQTGEERATLSILIAQTQLPEAVVMAVLLELDRAGLVELLQRPDPIGWKASLTDDALPHVRRWLTWQEMRLRRGA